MRLVGDVEERRIEVGRMSESGTAILRHADAAGLHGMWNALRGGRSAPFRAELDAGRIGAKAPFLAIFEHVGPSNFRIRIAGDRLNRWFGLELRGMSALAMIDGAARNHAQAALNRVVGDPAVGVLSGRTRALDGRAQAFEMVLLPMRSDFGRIDRVLAGVWLLDGPQTVESPVLLDVERAVLFPVNGPGPVAEPEPPVPPRDDRPTLTPLEGGPKQSPARRGHLRLVKKS
jgi:hypothetical protein